MAENIFQCRHMSLHSSSCIVYLWGLENQVAKMSGSEHVQVAKVSVASVSDSEQV